MAEELSPQLTAALQAARADLQKPNTNGSSLAPVTEPHPPGQVGLTLGDPIARLGPELTLHPTPAAETTEISTTTSTTTSTPNIEIPTTTHTDTDESEHAVIDSPSPEQLNPHRAKMDRMNSNPIAVQNRRYVAQHGPIMGRVRAAAERVGARAKELANTGTQRAREVANSTRTNIRNRLQPITSSSQPLPQTEITTPPENFPTPSFVPELNNGIDLARRAEIEAATHDVEEFLRDLQQIPSTGGEAHHQVAVSEWLTHQDQTQGRTRDEATINRVANNVIESLGLTLVEARAGAEGPLMTQLRETLTPADFQALQQSVAERMINRLDNSTFYPAEDQTYLSNWATYLESHPEILGQSPDQTPIVVDRVPGEEQLADERRPFLRNLYGRLQEVRRFVPTKEWAINWAKNLDPRNKSKDWWIGAGIGTAASGVFIFTPWINENKWLKSAITFGIGQVAYTSVKANFRSGAEAADLRHQQRMEQAFGQVLNADMRARLMGENLERRRVEEQNSRANERIRQMILGASAASTWTSAGGALTAVAESFFHNTYNLTDLRLPTAGQRTNLEISGNSQPVLVVAPIPAEVPQATAIPTPVETPSPINSPTVVEAQNPVPSETPIPFPEVATPVVSITPEMSPTAVPSPMPEPGVQAPAPTTPEPVGIISPITPGPESTPAPFIKAPDTSNAIPSVVTGPEPAPAPFINQVASNTEAFRPALNLDASELSEVQNMHTNILSTIQEFESDPELKQVLTVKGSTVGQELINAGNSDIWRNYDALGAAALLNSEHIQAMWQNATEVPATTDQIQDLVKAANAGDTQAQQKLRELNRLIGIGYNLKVPTPELVSKISARLFR